MKMLYRVKEMIKFLQTKHNIVRENSIVVESWIDSVQKPEMEKV